MRKFWIIVIGFIVCSSYAAAAEKLTYIDLINRLTDLEHLATLPAPGEKCVQWSSWDRDSKYDQASGKYLGWAANGDNDGVIREEDGKLVFAEMEGPGVIWRIWSARAQEGHVKIYLDGSKEPAVDLPFIGYFNRENEPFTHSSLVHKTAHGQNCYVPISYQKSCKIVAEKGWGAYYHFTYTTYPKGTILPTFKRSLSAAESIALDRANDILTNCGRDPAGQRRNQITELKSITIAPGTTATVAQLKGKRAITALKVKMNLPASPQDRDILRELALSIYWDGESEPSVWSPLGDFFGTAPGVNKYKSLPLGMTEDGFYSYWYMPFKKGAIIKLTNDGDKQRTVTFTITHAALKRSIKKLGRFHAKWHRDAFLPEDPDRREIDWTMIKTEGRGRFCGVMLHVWNPKGGWWGEGDEKFFVDGEKFPSTFGTGSEDYFGYAWCSPILFNNCYHNQTISMNNKGHISVNRWHITDNIPFQTSFEAAIEKYYPNSKPTLYASTIYWYLAADDKDLYKPAAISQRTGYCLTPLGAPQTAVLNGVFVDDRGEVSLSCSEKGADIRYTLDGTEPAENSKKYTSPIIITKNTTIKAKTFRGTITRKDIIPSEVVTITRKQTTWVEPENPADTVNGLLYEYYEGKWNSLDSLAGLKPLKSGVANNISLDLAKRGEKFGLKFTGYICIPRDGIYTFYVSSDDGSRIYIGDELLIDNDGLHGMRERAAQIALKAGKHAITVPFFQNAGGVGLKVSYAGPGIEKQLIPAKVLFHKK